MAYTLFDATLDAASALRINIFQGTVTTSHSATTATDTANTSDSDVWNNGTIWWESGLNIGKTSIVTDFASGGVFTYLTTTTLAEAGDIYTVINSYFPRTILRQAVNFALKEIGNVMQVDVTQPTVQNQAQYTLPTGVRNVRRVRVASSTVTPFNYYEVSSRHWDEVSGKFNVDVYFQQIASGFSIEYTYLQPAAKLTTDAGTISDNINPELLKWYAAAWAAGWKNGKMRGKNEWAEKVLQESLAMKEVMKARYIGQIGRLPPAHDDSPWMVDAGLKLESTPDHVRF